MKSSTCTARQIACGHSFQQNSRSVAMATAFKTSKPDLVAIYRLEFYKKQKNWKFCTTERKKEEERRKAAKNAKAKLNQTYSIEAAPERDKDTAKTQTEDLEVEEEAEKGQLEEITKQDAEPVPSEEGTDNLNEAFMDTETDDNTAPIVEEPPTGPYSPKWSIQQWAARCRPVWNGEPNCPNPPFVPNDPGQYPVWSNPSPCIPRDLTQPCLIQEEAIFGHAFTDYEADLLYERKDMPRSDTDLPHGAMLDADVHEWESRGGGGWGGAGGAGGWPRHSQVWTSRHEGWFEEICDIPEEAIEAIEALEGAGAGAGGGADAVDCAGAEWALLERAGDWLRSSTSLDKVPAMSRSDSLPSVSSGSFTRGAALAAHSTQLDLAGEGEGGAGAGAGALSAAALAAAVAGHAAALHALLSEARRRHLQVSPPPAEGLYSFDEYPTRDAGPAPHTPPPPPPHAHTPSLSSVYTHNPTVVNEVFVAGSYRNRPDLRGQTEDVGRGRGRKGRVVGIEMGRPYRL